MIIKNFHLTLILTSISTHCSPADYNQYTTAVQYNETLSLVSQLQLSGTERILDYGCRSGKISLWLSQQLPHGKVLAADHDQDMLLFAQKQIKDQGIQNTLFIPLNETSLSIYKNTFDYITSTAYLHWVGEYERHFSLMHELLKHGGKIVLRIGVSDKVGRNVPFQRHVDAIAARPRWANYFGTMPQPWYHPLDLASAQNILETAGFTLISISYVQRTTTFATTDELAHWILTWVPHAKYIPQDLTFSFACQVAERFDTVAPHDSFGNIILERPALEIIAQK